MAKKRTKKQVKKTKRPSKRKKTSTIKRTKVAKKTERPVKYGVQTLKKPKINLNNFRPIFAGLLNFFIWGAGYMFSGRIVYGLLWLLAASCIMIPYKLSMHILTTETMGYITVGYFLISALLAWDVFYRESIERYRI